MFGWDPRKTRLKVRKDTETELGKGNTFIIIQSLLKENLIFENKNNLNLPQEN